MVINTNVMAQATANLLGASSQRLSQSLARLSSGSKINTPADDAAGLAVSMNLNAQIGRTDAANNNIANALSFSQTQDGYLQQASNALDRMSELAVQAQDVTKSDSDRTLYNQEFQTLAAYVNNVGTKDFNGVSLFSGNDLNVTSDSEGGTFAMKGIGGSFLPPTITTTTTSEVSYAAGTQLGQISSAFNAVTNGETLEVGSGGPLFDTTITPNSTINDFVDFWNSTGGDSSASYDATTGQLTVNAAKNYLVADYGNLFSDLGLNYNATSSVSENLDNRFTSGSGPITMTTTLTHSVTTSTTTNSVLDISTAQKAASALTAIKNAISKVAGDRANIGANIEGLDFTSQQLSSLRNNLSAANSRIMDVDVAQESTTYARENILVQTGTAMLAQANALPQSVLKLLG